MWRPPAAAAAAPPSLRLVCPPHLRPTNVFPPNSRNPRNSATKATSFISQLKLVGPVLSDLAKAEKPPPTLSFTELRRQQREGGGREGRKKCERWVVKHKIQKNARKIIEHIHCENQTKSLRSCVKIPKLLKTKSKDKGCEGAQWWSETLAVERPEYYRRTETDARARGVRELSGDRESGVVEGTRAVVAADRRQAD
ncbi:uncharacterized protein LOC131012518 [Salvia miltiorrhiza]|uniref:uncharacterized protein LOC131012518 n=1 Tax=Salvia miltiorrhiza TaxID=226208 RepID=UPI0025AC7E90|nr:uncharacterized protein LOC131012518 [Salvia miltiorrhiza]